MDSAETSASPGIRRNALEIKLCLPFVTKRFLDLPVETFADVISEDELMVEKEEDVYFAVLDWVRHDTENRKDRLQDLLKLLRYGSLSSGFIQEQLIKEPLLKDSPKCLAVVREQLSRAHDHKKERRSTQDVPVIVGLQSDKAFCHDMESGTTYEIPSPVEFLMACRFDLNAAVEQNTMFAISAGNATEYPFVNCQIGVHQGVFLDGGWHCLPPCEVRRDNCCLVTLKGLVYVIGGENSGAVECFDPQTNLWKRVASLPKPCRCTTAVATDSHIFVIESQTRSGIEFYEHSVKKYNPVEDKWEFVTPIPRNKNAVETRSGVVFDAVFVHEKIYVLEEHNSLCNTYDPNFNKWFTIAAPTKTPTCEVDKLLNIDNELYSFHMDMTRNVQTKTFKFDQQSNEWQEAEVFGSKHLDGFTLFSMKVKIFYLKSLRVAPADFIPSLFVPRN